MKNVLYRSRLSLVRPVALTVLLMSLFVPQALAASDEYDSFGRSTANTLIDGNGQAFSDSLDKEAILNRVFEGVEHDTDTIGELRQGLSVGLDRIGDIFVANLEGSRIKYLRSRVKDNMHTALVRVDFGDRGINYLDFVLNKDKNGGIKITDWYDYSKGQYYTDSVRQGIVLLLPEQISVFEKILGTGGVNQKEVDQFIELGSLLSEHKYDEWLKLYDQMPDKLRNSRILLLTRILVAAAGNDESTYQAALKSLYDKMGDDPTLSLILLDHYYYEKDYASAQKALDRLAEFIGGDAAIDSLRANVYLLAEDYAQSMKYAEKSISADEEYEDAYWTLLSASILGKKYGSSVRALGMLTDEFGYDINPDDIEGNKDYKDFAASKEYKKWKESREVDEEQPVDEEEESTPGY